MTRASYIRPNRRNTAEAEVQEQAQAYAHQVFFAWSETDLARLVLKHWGLEDTWHEGSTSSTIGPVSKQTEHTVTQDESLVLMRGDE